MMESRTYTVDSIELGEAGKVPSNKTIVHITNTIIDLLGINQTYLQGDVSGVLVTRSGHILVIRNESPYHSVLQAKR